MGVVVDPFSVAEPSELPDWRLPLSFMKSRHVEKIQARGEVDEWRIRDRVCRSLLLLLYSCQLPTLSFLSLTYIEYFHPHLVVVGTLSSPLLFPPFYRLTCSLTHFLVHTTNR